LDFKFRIYDSRLGKFLSNDPLTKKYPWNSPYAYAENRVIDGRDFEGLEWAFGAGLIRSGANMNDVKVAADVTFTFLRHVSVAFSSDIKSFGKLETYSNALDAFSLMMIPDVSSSMSSNDRQRAQVIHNGISAVRNIPNWKARDWGEFAGHAAFAIALTKGSNAVIGAFREATPMFGRMSNLAAREWYLAQEAKIPSLLDKTAPIETQAKQAWALRNTFRTTSRELMANKEEAANLYKTKPNLTWDQTVKKYSNEKGEIDYQGIIEASQRSNKEVNAKLGIEPKKEK